MATPQKRIPFWHLEHVTAPRLLQNPRDLMSLGGSKNAKNYAQSLVPGLRHQQLLTSKCGQPPRKSQRPQRRCSGPGNRKRGARRRQHESRHSACGNVSNDHPSSLHARQIKGCAMQQIPLPALYPQPPQGPRDNTTTTEEVIDSCTPQKARSAMGAVCRPSITASSRRSQSSKWSRCAAVYFCTVIPSRPAFS